MGEDVGELFKAIRKSEGFAVDENSNFTKSEMNSPIFSFTFAP